MAGFSQVYTTPLTKWSSYEFLDHLNSPDLPQGLIQTRLDLQLNAQLEPALRS